MERGASGTHTKSFPENTVRYLAALAGMTLFVLGLPVLFGWRDLGHFSPDAAVAWGSYLQLQLLVGACALVCFGVALGSRRVGWYLTVTLFGSFTALGFAAAGARTPPAAAVDWPMIRTYVARIVGKLGAANRVQIAVAVLRGIPGGPW